MDAKFKAIINSNRPVLVDFHKQSSANCERLEPILRQVKGCLEDRIAIVKIDADKNAAITENFNISRFPTLLLFKNGKQLWRESGLIGTEAILGKIIEKHN